MGEAFSGEEKTLLSLLQRLAPQLTTEGRVAQRMAEARDALGEKNGAATEAVIAARLAALQSMTGKIASSGISGNGVPPEVRSVFSSSHSVIRPFLTPERLRQLSSSGAGTILRLLRTGDVLHVPITQEECSVILKQLTELPMTDFNDRIASAVSLLPGRTITDINRFLSQLRR